MENHKNHDVTLGKYDVNHFGECSRVDEPDKNLPRYLIDINCQMPTTLLQNTQLVRYLIFFAKY